MPLVISLILHSILMISLGQTVGIGGGGGGKKDVFGPVKGENISMRLLDKPNDTESKKHEQMLTEEESKVIIEKLPPEMILVEHLCDEYYVGIGVWHDNGEGCRVDYVGKGYPADRAGIQSGDLIVKQGDECPGRGEIGTMLTITWMRGTQVFTKTLVREKICTDQEIL